MRFVVCLLILVHGSRAAGQEQPRMPGFEGSLYANYGNVNIPRLNTLEELALDPIYVRCVRHGSPEMPPAIFTDRLPHITAEIKTRCLVHTVLTAHEWRPLPIEQLASEAGFRGLMLLDKLFSNMHVATFMLAPVQPGADEICRIFKNIVRSNRAGLAKARIYLGQTVRENLSLGLTQYARANWRSCSGLDLALYMHQLARIREVPLETIFMELAGILTNDYIANDQLKSLVCDAIRIALQPGTFERTRQARLAEHMFNSAIRDYKQECFELSLEYYGLDVFSQGVSYYVQTSSYNEVSALFIRKYLEHVRANDTPPGEYSLELLMSRYLPHVSKFHTGDLIWSRNPEYLNAIPPIWLSNLFTKLRDEKKYAATRRPFMYKCMGILRYSVFFDIIRNPSTDDARNLAVFMLEYLSEDMREAYAYSLRRDVSAGTFDESFIAAWEHIAYALKLPAPEVEAIRSSFFRT
ncbi:hypothetical protein PAPHI01_1138 [Pancytospora philotis]|nr:hypothetical protein PAPHI01_1138 [Pancytospora philotis]